MTHTNPEQRLARIEKTFAGLDHGSKRHFQQSDRCIKACSDRTSALQFRFEDLDGIEATLFEAFAETHPKADRDLLAIIQATDWDFINLPSVKTMRDRS